MEDKEIRQENGAAAPGPNRPNSMRWVAIALAVAAAIVIALSVLLIVRACDADTHDEHHFVTWAQDETEHWQVCDECDATTERAPHTWGEWTRTREPDCTQPGEQARICLVCGYRDTEEIAALGHTYGEWVIFEDATCMEAGTLRHSCTVCSYTETQSIEPTGHTFGGDWHSDGTAHWQTCFDCGEAGERISHSWNEGETTALPGPGTEGETTYTCTICGATHTQTMPASEHVWGEWELLQAPTCTESGQRQHACTVCGEVESEIVPAAGHIWSDWRVTAESDCTAAGEEMRWCDECGAAETRALPLGEHTLTAQTIVRTPTCTEEGEPLYS